MALRPLPHRAEAPSTAAVGPVGHLTDLPVLLLPHPLPRDSFTQSISDPSPGLAAVRTHHQTHPAQP